MNLEDKICNFFRESSKKFTQYQLERIFSITDDEKNQFLSILDFLVKKNTISLENGRYFSLTNENELTKKLDDFFSTHNKIYSLRSLEKIFKIDSFNRLNFYKSLNDLEMRGKIFCIDDNAFVHLAKDSYIKCGCLKESKQGKYFVKLDNRIITIENIGNAKPLDIVFIEEDLSRRQHPHHGFGKIIRIVKPISSLPPKDYLTNGTIIRNAKNDSYWLEKDLVKIPIKKKDLNGAYPGDVANFLISFDNNSKPFAKVTNIIERKNNKHIFIFRHGKWHPLGTEDFNVTFKDENIYEDYDQILAKVSTKKINGKYTIELIEKINDGKTTPRDKIKLFAIDRGLSFDFDPQVIKEANAINKEITPEEKNKRLDLRNLETFTIDSSYAKDLDDAVSLEKTKEGFRLYVHIADVSYYIRPNTALFNDVLKRGTSVYFGDMVIPQLPEVISNGVCSLNPHEEKLTKTLIMDFDNKANLLNFSLYNSLIKSDMKMSYDKVNDLIEGTNIDKDYIRFYKTLIYMQDLAKKLEEKRIERGSTSFSAAEYIYELDEDGKPISISERSNGPAQKIIEHFMIVTNQILADYAYWLELPYIYRNHECPQFDKIKILNAKVKQISQKFRKIKELDDPRALQKYYEHLCKDKSSSEIKYLSNLFLQSLPRAYYENVNKGHYGLALSRYATFTLPIRRGPDLLNHLFLGEVLEKGVGTDLLEKMRPLLQDISFNLSIRQQEADNFEQEVDYLLLKEFAMDFTDKELNATIEFLTNDKIYLRTPNNLTGVIELDKNYTYNITNNTVKDLKRNIYYNIGDTIKVKILTFDSKKHNIIFTLCPSKEKETPKIMKKQKVIAKKEK